MYHEIMKRFDFGKDMKTLHPINDMEIEYCEGTDEVPGDQADIKDLVLAQENIEEQLLKPEIVNLQIENIN